MINSQKLRYWKNRLLGMGHAKAYSQAANVGYAQRVEELLEDELGGGKKQFDFLVQNGLLPTDRLLDLGCGYLRGGQYFIEYLEPGNYTGMDMAAEGIDAARDILGTEFFETNRPNFVQNTDLRFTEFDADEFDYVIAHSVFTHLKESEIRECLNHIGRVLKPDGKFYATYFDAAERSVTSSTVFAYTKSEFWSMAEDTDLAVEFLMPAEYAHADDQRMMEVSREG